MNKKATPKKYIISKARSLPFYECFIEEEWKELGLTSIIISKKMLSNNYIVAIYLVDIYCLGLKNTGYKFNLLEVEYENYIKKWHTKLNNLVKLDITSAHNIIYGATDYAAELGFKPHPDFKITEHFLNPDLIDDGIDEIEFGKDGKPLFVEGPNDNVTKITNTLNRNIGEGNYNYITLGGGF